MAQTRRDFLRCAAGLGGLLLTGAAGPVAPRRAAAWRSALDFLAGRQAPDGAWRSDRYAAFRDGDALTPVVLWGVRDKPGAEAMIESGLRWLERLTDAQSQREEPWMELRYPLFTASYAAQVMARSGDGRRARMWAGLIERLRTSEKLGWPSGDPACGAWGDAPSPPRFTQPVPDMLAPNISATALATLALCDTGPVNAARSARSFVERCQNFGSTSGDEFDDGGFFFAIDDPVRNKAGVGGVDASGQRHFHSYGSATCDGLLALHACGLAANHPRMTAAREWLRRNGDLLIPGGEWSPGRGAARESLVYYHAQALAAVLEMLAPSAPWAADRRLSLAADLVARQLPNGSWQGEAPNSCEDEPLLATAFALRAL